MKGAVEEPFSPLPAYGFHASCFGFLVGMSLMNAAHLLESFDAGMLLVAVARVSKHQICAALHNACEPLLPMATWVWSTSICFFTSIL
jgi:hypothetical protein